MHILVVGAGAVGGYFGGRLAQAGRQITFLVRPRRAEELRRNGLQIVSPAHGDATIAPSLITAADIRTPYDLIFLSVKGYALSAAMEDFAAAVGPETMILPVLNGLQHMERLTERFGPGPVIGGVCLVATDLDAQGRIVQLADIQQLRYGELSGQETPRLRALDAAMQGAGFAAAFSTDIVQAMWEKWVQLASLGAVTCLLRGRIGDVVAAPGGVALSRAILSECAAIATACGHKPSNAFMVRQTDALTAAGSPLTSSMYRDLKKGAPVEVDAILGHLLDQGRAHGVTTPLLEAAFVSLRIYQDSLSQPTR